MTQSVAFKNRTPPLRVLIVEDDYLASIDLEASLTDIGIAVCGIARSATDAIVIADQARPDVIIFDVRLQGERSGIDAAIEIYERFEIRSIFATAHDEIELRKQADPAQPLGWVHKPYQIQNVADVLLSISSMPPSNS